MLAYVIAMFHQRAESPLLLNGYDAARRFFADCLAETDPLREHLWVAHVDDRARCLHLSRHDGDEGGASIPLRQVIADAAIHGKVTPDVWGEAMAALILGLRDNRPGDGMASYIATRLPASASVSAAINPAGPAPMMAIS